MTPQTLKMLVMFLLAAALLNVTNYLFYWLYDPPSRQAMRLEVRVADHTNLMRLMTKRRVTHRAKWSDLLLCEDKNSSRAVEDNKISKAPEYDYRDQKSDSSNFYYFNGIKMGDKICPEIPPALVPPTKQYQLQHGSYKPNPSSSSSASCRPLLDLTWASPTEQAAQAPNSGPLKPNVTASPQEIKKIQDLLQVGGIYKEPDCVPRESVAIIITHREQENQLLEFIYSMHSFLMKQQLEYQIFVVKQSNKTTPLNVGKLFNVGFTEAHGMKKNGEWRCLVFHDHNIVPVDSRNLYRCSNRPLQLVTQLGTRSYKYGFGGAIAVKPRQFLKVNGFSHVYNINNDAAFEDLYERLIQANYTTAKTSFGMYERVNSEEIYETRNHQPMQTSSPLNLIDGLSTLSYTLNMIDLKPMYTLIDVDIDKPQFNSSSMWEKLLNQATTVGTQWRNYVNVTKGLEEKIKMGPYLN